MRKGHYKSSEINLESWYAHVDINGKLFVMRWMDNILKVRSGKDLKIEKDEDTLSISFKELYESPLEYTDKNGKKYTYTYNKQTLCIDRIEIKNAKRRLKYKRLNDNTIMNEPLFPVVSSFGNYE